MRSYSKSSYLYSQVVIKPDCLITYPVFDSKRKYIDESKRSASLENLKSNKTKGVLSYTSQKKLKYAINLLVAQAKWKKVYCYKEERSFKFKVNFITLTLSSPQGSLTDNFIKRKILTPFIQDLKRLHNLKSYVWKAETQENGNIHFHITTDVYIHYSDLRYLWNRHQNKAGLLDSFYQQYHHRNPNSTDIHSVKKIGNLAAYMVKYMCKKQENRRAVIGSIWGCSDNLKYIHTFADVSSNEVFREVQSVMSDNVTLVCDYFTYTKIHYSQLPKGLLKQYYKFLSNIRNGKVESTIFESGINRSAGSQICGTTEIVPFIPLSQTVQLALFDQSTREPLCYA